MSQFFCFVLCLLAVDVDESEKATDVAKRRSDEAIKVAKKHAMEYDIYIDEDRKKKLTLHSKPVLRWTNPVPQETDAPSAEVYGGIFIWTFNGRPEVIASIFKWYSPYKHVSHELQSLSLRKVEAFRGSRLEWYPSIAGVILKRIPDGPKVAETPIRRGRQLKSLARAFSADKINSKGDRTQLRRLTQPLYRYKSTNPDIVDGAVFVFVEGTDPEVVLLLEARKRDSPVRFHFAAARLNHLHLRLYHRKNEVWSVDAIVPYKKVLDRSKPYTSITRRP